MIHFPRNDGCRIIFVCSFSQTLPTCIQTKLFSSTLLPANFFSVSSHIGLKSHKQGLSFCGHLSSNGHNRGKAQPIRSHRLMRGNRSCGVKSYPGSGRKEMWLRERESLPDSLIMRYFFPLLLKEEEKGGKSYLEGVLKEIHVGINPDIIESAPCFHHIPSSCSLLC